MESGRPRDIPGFYWDEERGRYFKIETGPSFGAETRHTPAQIKVRGEVRKQKKRADDNASAREFGRSILNKTLILPPRRVNNTLLNREIGHSSEARGAMIRKNWQAASVAGFVESPVLRAPVHPERGFHHEYFDCDPLTGALYLAGFNYVDRLKPIAGKMEPAIFNMPRHMGDYPVHYKYHWQHSERAIIRVPFDDQISSMEFLPRCRGLAITTFGASSFPQLSINPVDRQPTFTGQIFTLRVVAAYTVSPKPPFSTGGTNSIPSSDLDMLAVGTSSGLQLFSNDANSQWQKQRLSKNGSSSDRKEARAVAWLSSNYVAAGHRNGTILLYDLRANGHAAILKPPGPITKILATQDDTRLVVRAGAGEVGLYDLRTQGRAIPAVPSRTFDIFTIGRSGGLDVYAPLNLLASSDGLGAIQVWSLTTGKILRHFHTWDPPEVEKGVTNNCLRWVEGNGGPGDVSVWSWFEDGLSRFGW